LTGQEQESRSDKRVPVRKMSTKIRGSYVVEKNVGVDTDFPCGWWWWILRRFGMGFLVREIAAVRCGAAA